MFFNKMSCRVQKSRLVPGKTTNKHYATRQAPNPNRVRLRQTQHKNKAIITLIIIGFTNTTLLMAIQTDGLYREICKATHTI